MGKVFTEILKNGSKVVTRILEEKGSTSHFERTTYNPNGTERMKQRGTAPTNNFKKK